MNILIVGSGAREHAIAKALSLSAHVPSLFCYASSRNPGIVALTKGFLVGTITDCDAVVRQALDWDIDMAIIGPEAPLEQGLADALWASRIPVIGPKKKLAQIETSKAFTRQLMSKYNIAGLPRYQVFSSAKGVRSFLEVLGEGHYVVKANGLMGGKGVKVAGEHLHSIEEAQHYCDEIFAQGQTLVIEEKLVGQEFSFMCFSDGETIVPMPIIQDHKRAYVGDKGPNTGGMGSYSAPDHSLPFLSAMDVEAAAQINKSVLAALQRETSESYVGILYGGFIATSNGVYVIEFNARFGDPEALNVLSILESDFVDLCLAITSGTLKNEQVRFAHQATVCKYAVPEGYPDHPLRDAPIDVSGVRHKEWLYLAAVDETENQLVATGSRTAAYVGIAASIAEAEQMAESEISQIKGALFHREDIGTEPLIQRRIEAMRRLRAL